MSNSYRLALTPVTVKTSPVERLPSPSESASARVPFANVPRIPLARETSVNTAIPFSRRDARKVRFMASSGLQNKKFAVACHGFVPWVVNVSAGTRDRKSTRLNSSHSQISYAVFCLKKKKKQRRCNADESRGHIRALRDVSRARDARVALEH